MTFGASNLYGAGPEGESKQDSASSDESGDAVQFVILLLALFVIETNNSCIEGPIILSTNIQGRTVKFYSITSCHTSQDSYFFLCAVFKNTKTEGWKECGQLRTNIKSFKMENQNIKSIDAASRQSIK